MFARMSANASWMSLLSTLTLGAGAGAVRAQLRAEDVQTAGNRLRLVVQAYDEDEGRTVGAIQRAVTPAELKNGVSVDVPHVASSADPLVVAWVERGAPDLEHDGLDAKPKRGSLIGCGRGEGVRINLSRGG